MTSDTPPGSVFWLTRGWRAFRRWRRSRPFWGGLLLILSGLEILLSANQDLGSIQLHIGTTGYLSYVIPAVLALCGLLIWLTPAQRLFYSVIGVITALFSVISVNLGGFFIGLLLGLVGGALSGAWAPVAPDPGAGTDPDGLPESDPDAAHGHPDDAADQDATFDEILSGPLSDQLPTATRSPLADPATRSPLADPVDQPDATPPGRHSAGRAGGTALILLVLSVGLVGAVTLRDSGPAQAAPCGSTPASGPTPASGSTAKPVPTTVRPAAKPAPASPATSPAPAQVTSSGNPITGAIDAVVGGVEKLLGLGGTADPSAAASASPSAPGPIASSSASPTPGRTTTPKPSPTKTRLSPKPKPKPTSTCTAAAPAPAARLAAAAGQPFVVGPAKLTTDRLDMTGSSFDGVVDLPLKNGGTITSLQFSMASATQTPFRLAPPGTAFTARTLTVAGNVKFYCTRFSGYLFGLVPVTFTPTAPPPLTLPTMWFTQVDIDLIFVRADQLTSSGFGVANG